MTLLLTSTSVFAENKNQKVVVVGAGLAGLTAAYRLQQNGMDVHVYEARNRVGGRVFSVNIGDSIAELGGQNFTDGGDAENIYRLIEEFGFELLENKINPNLSYFTGEKLIPIHDLLRDKQFPRENIKVQLEELAQKSQNMREVMQGLLSEDEPLYKALSVRLAAYEGAPIEKLSTTYIETLHHMLHGGISVVYQNNNEEEGHITFLSIKEGNSRLPERMAQAIGSKLHLNMPLTKVSKNQNGSFALTFQDDQKVEADILILAIPCSVYNEITFEENAIPLDTLNTIKDVQYGTNAKIMVRLKNPPQKSIGFINDRIVCAFDASRSLVTLYFTDTTSKFSQDTIDFVYNSERPIMDMGFGDLNLPSIPPILAADQTFYTYVGPVGHSWPNDPYAKGSYSYVAPGQEKALMTITEIQGEMVKSLFAPIDQKLYFAGEHTSILMDVPGTMEAACESGERTARMVLNSF